MTLQISTHSGPTSIHLMYKQPQLALADAFEKNKAELLNATSLNDVYGFIHLVQNSSTPDSLRDIVLTEDMLADTVSITSNPDLVSVVLSFDVSDFGENGSWVEVQGAQPIMYNTYGCNSKDKQTQEEFNKQAVASGLALNSVYCHGDALSVGVVVLAGSEADLYYKLQDVVLVDTVIMSDISFLLSGLSDNITKFVVDYVKQHGVCRDFAW